MPKSVKGWFVFFTYNLVLCCFSHCNESVTGAAGAACRYTAGAVGGALVHRNSSVYHRRFGQSPVAPKRRKS